MKTIRIFCLLLVSLICNAQTEKNVDHQSLLWTRYSNQLTLNSKWLIQSEFDNRVFIHPFEENLFLIRVQGRYKISKDVDLGAGLAYFSVATQDPENTNDFRTPEYRGEQNITWKQEFGKITMNQRFQVEERFFHNANKDGLQPGTNFNWRFRYRLQGEYWCWKKESQYLKVILYDEIFINTGENIVNNTFDQNRIYGSLQYGFTKNIAFELGYLNSFQKRPSGFDYYNRDIIRFTLYHKIQLKEKQKAPSN
jgi:hypothetical protein